MFRVLEFCVLVVLVVLVSVDGQIFRPGSNQIDDKPQYTNPLQAAIAGNLFRNNRQCPSNDGGVGTCMTNAQCRRRQGRSVGSCSGLFQTCCKEERTCDQDVTRNNTYFVQPSRQEAMVNLQCGVRVLKLAGVCQLRLDFEQFSLRGPETVTGKCERDTFVVNGRDFNQVVPPICGENDGQHVYIDVGSVKGPVTLRVVTSEKPGDTTMYRRWNVRISQIPCASIVKAPQGCLQYFTGPVPQNVKSWNYGNLRPGEETYPSGLDYTVCVRKEYGMCAVNFEAEGKFGVLDDETKDGKNEGCDKDYLWIGDKKYCGGKELKKSPAVVQGGPEEPPRTIGTGPLMFHVVTSTDARTAETKWPGFNIKMRQEICQVRRLL